jgi:butyryl-CoA dehydrogenase
VLARIEGAPAGTAGISLFIVPKIWVNEDGSLGEPNDVVCTGIEEKMGIHGNSTCSLALGSKGKCRGTLLGDANKGMRAMFLMMNDARLMVGNQALACASPAYLYAVNYARTRVQGRHLLKMMDKDAPAVPIIQHPDVRRMLMHMKVYVEGLRSLSYYIAFLNDRVATSADADEKTRCQGIIDFLIPIAKGYTTERCFDVCSLGVQVYGGYGYIKEFPMEQLLRDCRITAIYEGTNGIQAMDLLGRKVLMEGGRGLQLLAGHINATIERAIQVPALAAHANALGKALQDVGAATKAAWATGQPADALANAVPYMQAFGHTVLAWVWLDVALATLARDADLAQPASVGRMGGMRFFFHYELPKIGAWLQVVSTRDATCAAFPEEAF